MTGTLDNLLAAVRSDPGNVASRLVYADSLEESGDTLAAIMQRAIAEPGNDGHRLALANALERTAGEVACGTCKGKPAIVKLPVPTEIRLADGRIVREIQLPPFKPFGCTLCRGSGRVSDGRAELAAFIRVQVELAAEHSDCGTKGYGPCGKRCEELRRRERELWGYLPSRNGVRSLFESTLPGAAFCTATDGGKHLGRGFPIIIVQRGLPSVVRCTLAEWMGDVCKNCWGEGWRANHGSDHPIIDAITCPTCHGSGRTPGIGPRLAQAWPVERVEVTDAVIHRSGGNDTYYVGGLGRFPKEFWRALEGHRTASAARDALSAASIQWARSQVI